MPPDNRRLLAGGLAATVSRAWAGRRPSIESSSVPLLTRRRAPVLVLDAALFFLAYLTAHVIRMDPVSDTPGWTLAWTHFQRTVVIVVLAKVVVFLLGGTYRGLVQYATVADLIVIARNATAASVVALFMIAVFQDFRFFSRGVFAIDWMVTMGLVSGSRLVRRLAREGAFDLGGSEAAKRVVIVGAGRAGVALAKDLRTAHRREVDLLGFVDDDPDKQNATLLGRPIFGTTSDLPHLIKNRLIDQVVVAIPSATPRDIQRIAGLAAGVADFRVIPAFEAILSGRVPIGQTMSVPAENFLTRQSVDLATVELERFFSGKRVLITGAGGSIGSELARQLARGGEGGVADLLLLDAAETPLYDIERQVRATLGDRTCGILASVRDTQTLKRLLARHQPQIILHAAALKHVPLCETHPLEAVRTNTLATAALAEAAEAMGVECFVLVSTDKAVAPASVMGATKRAAEIHLQSIASAKTRFLAVRFGNVLGSNGSVLPLFHEQIAKGGPVTITDPRVTRFFMTISEACGLILHATRISRGGDVHVLDMGDPVPIIDVAHNLIRLYGYEPGKDIEIRVTGLRPGEKLHEILLDEGESAEPSEHPKIRRVTRREAVAVPPLGWIGALEAATQTGHADDALEVLQTIVAGYRTPRLDTSSASARDMARV